MKYLNYLICTFLMLLVLISCNCNRNDSDCDGVVDSEDYCRNTPSGEKVDKNGCTKSQLEDDDDDGIPNWAECGEENVVFSKTEVVFRFPRKDIENLRKSQDDRDDLINAFGDILDKYYEIVTTDFSFDDLIKSIETIELCACGDLSPVLVTFSSDFDIETKLDNLKEDTSEGGVEGDLNFNFNLLLNETPNEVAGFNIAPLPGEFKSIKPSFISESKKVIAVLDTGIDLLGQYSTDFRITGAERFIYKYDGLSDSNDCLNAYDGTGWNFADDNSNFYDDHSGIGHGTLVTKTLTNELARLKITDYSILPLKVFDNQGKGSYWKINCAMAYLNEIQENTQNATSRGDIKLINASFGGSFTALHADDLGVMKSFIDSLGDSALFVTSAGNCGEDTDSTITHFPSGYTSDNIVSVGGYKMEGSSSLDKDVFSNYGINNIDVAAPFALGKLEAYIIDNTGTRVLGTTKVEGTSFSTAFVSAKLFEIQFNKPGSSPVEIIEIFNFDHTGIESNLSEFFKESRFYKPEQN